ncbi:MAG: hypothetical protein AAGD38_12415 [Acidobacteriota bacterium]
MKRSLFVLLVLMFVSVASASAGVWGQPEITSAATLVVPMVESGINAGTHPHDTLPVIYNQSGGTATVHWEIWSVDGVESENLFGEVTIPPLGTWSGSMRDLMASQSTAADRARMAQGPFYRGFMTFDVISESTTDGDTPFDADYPFSNNNILTGYIYYVRLAEGSSNGLPMLHIEAVDSDADTFLEGFYASNGIAGGNREEIDVSARGCAIARSQGQSGPCTADADGLVDRIRLRMFLQPPTGETRIIVFAWNTFDPEAGGPTALCTASGTCDTSYSYRRWDLSGNLIENRSITLPNVVNVIDPIGTGSGEAVIFDIPNVGNATQFYAFTFNSFTPASGSASWDAIFPASIIP